MLRLLTPRAAARPTEPEPGLDLYRSEAFAEDLQEWVRPLPQWQRGVPPVAPRWRTVGDGAMQQRAQAGSDFAAEVGQAVRRTMDRVAGEPAAQPAA